MEKFNSVFSNYLAEARIIKSEEEFLKASDVYARLRNTYNQGVKGLCYCRRIFLPREDEDYEYFADLFHTMFIYDDQLKDVIKWVNEKIVFQLDTSLYQTIGVRLRIATGMINKLVYEKRIPEHLGMQMHYHLVQNISSESCMLYSQDLPF